MTAGRRAGLSLADEEIADTGMPTTPDGRVDLVAYQAQARAERAAAGEPTLSEDEARERWIKARESLDEARDEVRAAKADGQSWTERRGLRKSRKAASKASHQAYKEWDSYSPPLTADDIFRGGGRPM